MSQRFKNYGHVLRMASLFGVGIVIFLIARWIMVPSDFGVYGFFRAGALKDVMARPMAYAGRASCAECHTDVVETRKGTKHEQIGCEACHGPLAKHASGDLIDPGKPNGKTVCLPCHAKMDGRPANFPQIDVAEHAGDASCVDCHKPHSPAIQ
jgi:hypothetical protein